MTDPESVRPPATTPPPPPYDPATRPSEAPPRGALGVPPTPVPPAPAVAAAATPPRFAVRTLPDPDGPGWINQQGDATLSRHRTKGAATLEGRRLAIERCSEHAIHDRRGREAERRSYGAKPPPTARRR